MKNGNPPAAAYRQRSLPALLPASFSLAALVLTVSALTTVVHMYGWLRAVETPALDLMLSLSPITAEHVLIVTIDNRDYKELMQNKSPLAVSVVEQLLAAIAAGNPAVIVVDLDTADPSFKALALPDRSSRIVWARGLEMSPNVIGQRKTPEELKRQHPGGGYAGVVATPFLGGGATAGDARWGLAILPLDADGILRHYFREVLVDLDVSAGAPIVADSLPWAAVRAFRNAAPAGGKFIGREMVLGFTVQHIQQISALHLLSLKGTAGYKELLKGKIVLLGGSYAAARDSYLTPVGWMPGVEVVANAIETEISRGGITPIASIHLFFVLVVTGFAASAMVSAIKGLRGLLLATVLLPVSAFAASYMAFQSLALWADFIPVVIAVPVYFLVEHIRRVQKQNLELSLANEELRRTKADLARAIDRGAEQERQRLALELHDDTLGTLSEVSLRLESQADGCDGGAAAGATVSSVRQTIKNLREIISGLYPSVLEKYGLVDAIGDLCNRTSSAAVACEFIGPAEPLPDWLAKEERLLLYRIVQEALNNARKHAAASSLRVTLACNSGHLTLTVADNGRGMPEEGILPGTYGLDGMRTKAEILGASIQWSSPPEGFAQGTEVRLSMPAKRQQSPGLSQSQA